jgi:hypothetical protein
VTSIPVRSKFATDAITRYAKATKATDGGAKFGAAYDKAQQARAAAAKPAAKPAATAAAKPAATATAKPAAKSMVSDARRAELSANYKKNYAAAMAPFKDRIATKNAAKAAAATTAVKKATGGYVTKPTFKW